MNNNNKGANQNNSSEGNIEKKKVPDTIENRQGSENRYINPGSPYEEEEINKEVNDYYTHNPLLISQIFGEGDMWEVNDPEYPYKHYFEAVYRRPAKNLAQLATLNFRHKGYEPTEPQQRAVTVQNYVYQMKGYHQKTEDQYIVTTCPHEDMDKIFKDFYEPSKIAGGYRKKIPKDKTLAKYMTDLTLAHIYMLIGIEWIHTDTMVGLDLRKFTKQEVLVFRSFIEKTFKIKGHVARATDANFVIIFLMDQALRFLDLIEEYVIKALYTKLGDHYWGARDEINFGPAILKLIMDPIEIVDESEELEIINDE